MAVRARTVLGDLAEDWLENGRRMNYTPWRASFYSNGYWLNLVELDFLEANLDEYRQMRTKTLEEEKRRSSRWTPTIRLHALNDDSETPD